MYQHHHSVEGGPVSVTPGSPGLEDESVGAVLARIRREKRITGAGLAAMVSMSQPKISRIERGKVLPDPDEVRLIAHALDLDESTTLALTEQAERSLDRMTDWRRPSADWPNQQKTLADWESSAAIIRCFEVAAVPGLLQTSGYARATLSEFQRMAPLASHELTEAALLAAISARFQRQEILADRGKEFRFVLGEATLKRQACPPGEMLAQISHLREISTENANVSIRMILNTASTPIPLIHGFALIDDDLVIIDLYNTGLLSRSRKDIESFRRVFDMIEEHATDIGPQLDEYEAFYIEALRRQRAAGPETDGPGADRRT